MGSNPTPGTWGCSSNGRARALHARGKGIDAPLFQFFSSLPDMCRECSSNGRARASHARGKGIDAPLFQRVCNSACRRGLVGYDAALTQLRSGVRFSPSVYLLFQLRRACLCLGNPRSPEGVVERDHIMPNPPVPFCTRKLNGIERG